MLFPLVILNLLIYWDMALSSVEEELHLQIGSLQRWSRGKPRLRDKPTHTAED
jgi:hypothetical protein